MPDSMIYGAVIFAFLRTEYSAVRHGVKQLAADAGVSSRTAENWLAGHCAPTGESLLTLMASCPALEAVINDTIAARRAAARAESAAIARLVEQRKERRNAAFHQNGGLGVAAGG